MAHAGDRSTPEKIFYHKTDLYSLRFIFHGVRFYSHIGSAYDHSVRAIGLLYLTRLGGKKYHFIVHTYVYIYM